MPEITVPIADFVRDKGAQTISPITSPGPAQRGPTCGFYALGYVMQYWFERQEMKGGPQKPLTAPLPVRTSTTPSQEQHGFFSKTAKSFEAWTGNYSSLRHYGKYNKLTAYGSVFNAESMVKVAKGQGAQYAGQYDGRVVTAASPADLVTDAKKFLARECPLIIPFDVGDDGDPATGHSGTRAHWAVIVGAYSEASEDYFIHYHWGKYRYAKAQAFADSNFNLTSNNLVEFQKYEVRRSDGSIFSRDYRGPSFSSQVPGMLSQGAKVKKLGGPAQNLEFNDLTGKKAGSEAMLVELQNHGFDPDNLKGAGLIKKLVAVFPQAEQGTFSTL